MTEFGPWLVAVRAVRGAVRAPLSAFARLLRAFDLSEWLALLGILTGFLGFQFGSAGLVYLAVTSWALFALNEWRTPPRFPGGDE